VPEFFGAIHGRIDAGQKILPGGVFVLDNGVANAARGVEDIATADKTYLAHGFDDGRCDPLHHFGVGLRKQNGELFATDLRLGVYFAASGLSQDRRYLGQDLVADGMPVAIVDVLEMVEIEKNDADGSGVAPGATEFTIGDLGKCATVQEPCRRVRRTQRKKLPVGTFQLFDRVLEFLLKRQASGLRLGPPEFRAPALRMVQFEQAQGRLVKHLAIGRGRKRA